MIPATPPGLSYVPPRTAIVRTIAMQSTAYCYGAVTFTGEKVGPGSAAVDPRIIPLHSYMLIAGHFFLADDTGSAVKGKIVDLYTKHCADAWQWGRRNVQVAILGGIVAVPPHKRIALKHRSRHREARFKFMPIAACLFFGAIFGAVLAFVRRR